MIGAIYLALLLFCLATLSLIGTVSSLAGRWLAIQERNLDFREAQLTAVTLAFGQKQQEASSPSPSTTDLDKPFEGFG